MAQLLSIRTIEGAEKGFAVTKFLIKIISFDPFDMTVANHAYFAAMLSYTRLSAIILDSRNGGRCEVLDVFLCDKNIWSFIGVYGIFIWALKDMIRLFFCVIVGHTVVIRSIVRIIIFPSIFQLNQ